MLHQSNNSAGAKLKFTAEAKHSVGQPNCYNISFKQSEAPLIWDDQKVGDKKKQLSLIEWNSLFDSCTI